LTLSHLDPANRELQRAECQLGVAYMDMADREKEDPWKSDSLLKLAKEHLTEALQLADAASLQKALVDAHNNLGLLAMQINDMPLAMKHLKTGLALCDKEYPDSESRLHHSLGTFFSKRGDKKEAVKHIREDIRICHQIKHLQGEGKGFLNLGDLHCKFHSYEDALDAYRKAESIFRGLTDEDELVKAAQNNIEVAIERRAAKQDLDDAPKDLRKLDIKLADAKGTERERALQTRKAKKLRELIDIANRIDEFEKVRPASFRFGKICLRLAQTFCHVSQIASLSCKSISFVKARRLCPWGTEQLPLVSSCGSDA
jgi:tetratricopeptide (TPR) repeat protein